MLKEKLTIRLPKENLDFVKNYAAAHRITVTEVINRYLQQLRTQHSTIDPEVEQISGLVPNEINARAIYHDHLLAKHK